MTESTLVFIFFGVFAIIIIGFFVWDSLYFKYKDKKFRERCPLFEEMDAELDRIIYIRSNIRSRIKKIEQEIDSLKNEIPYIIEEEHQTYYDKIRALQEERIQPKIDLMQLDEMSEDIRSQIYKYLLERGELKIAENWKTD